MLEFTNLNYLYILIPIIIFLFILYKKGGQNIIFGDVYILNKIFKTNSIYYKIYYFILIVIFILFTLIFSNLVSKHENIKQSVNGIDIVIALDVSGSMAAEDLKPNRLESAKKIISKFIVNLETDRLGIVIFSGKAFTSIPLNFDYHISKNIVSGLTTETINQRFGGTAIGEGILKSAQTFEDNNREKIVILLTDGDNTGTVTPESAIKYILKENRDIKFYTVGIGSKNGYIGNSVDFFGNKKQYKIAGINEEVLRSVSLSTGGKYFNATDSDTLESIFKEIEKLEKSELEKEIFITYKDKNIYLIYLLLLSFFLLLIIKYKKLN